MTHPDEMNDYVKPAVDAAAVHAAAVAAFTDDYFDESASPWSSADIANRVMMGHRDQDSLAIRVLAGRIATSPTPQPDDPLHTLKDLGRALGAIASATSTIIRENNEVDELEPEQLQQYRDTVQHLIAAGRGLEHLSGWF